LRTAIEQLVEFAADADVILAIEPMHAACAREWTFLTDVAKTVEFIESFDSPFLKLVLDTYHFGDDPWVRGNLAAIVPHIAVVHLGDRVEPPGVDQDRRPLGDGRLELAELVRELVDAGYSGDFDVELIGCNIQQGDYEGILKSSLDFFERVMAPA
jgi:sugar phosphate isomerase/epimerase